MDHSSRPQEWWSQIEQLHRQIVAAWIDGTRGSAQFSLGRPPAASLDACRDYPEAVSAGTQDASSSPPARTVLKLNDQLAWGLQKINQFKSLSENARESIRERTLEWLSDLQRGLAMSDQRQWSAHVQGMCSQYLEELESLSSELRHNRERITSEEYSVKLQLQVLHLTVDEMREPILDVGCGKDAALVKWLVRHRKNALGIDLCVNPMRGCRSVDWFKFPFVPGHFGTITAHLSFSLHFLKHHLDLHGQAESYAKQYMSMLRSLQVGGAMVYAPGLPFIEKLLPSSTYRVLRFAVDDFPRDDEAAQVYASHLGDDPLYACHVERI
jgi:hypothetical protein